MLESEVSYSTFHDQGVSLLGLYNSLFLQSTTLDDKRFWQRLIRLTQQELEDVAHDDRQRQTQLYNHWKPLEEQLTQVRSMF